LSRSLDIKELEKALEDGTEITKVRFSKDGKVRFAPKRTYTLGEHSAQSLARDGFIIASFGQEGAENLGEVSSKFKKNPYVYGVEVKEDQALEQRVTELDSGWYVDVRRLNVVGGSHGNGGGGYSLGVFK